MKHNAVEFKNFDIIEHKQDANNNLVITGYGAYFNNIDSTDDIIKPGSFTETLSDRAGRIAFCYQHDIWNPIGKIQQIKEDDKGLWIEVMLSAADDDIQTKVKEGILKEMSIGYRTVDSHTETVNGDEIRVITKVKLYEVSLVTIAANPMAVVESMKSDEQRKDFIESEFDRLIAVVRNENIKFEISKLKPIVLSALAKSDPEPPKEQLKAADYLSLLTAGKN